MSFDNNGDRDENRDASDTSHSGADGRENSPRSDSDGNGDKGNNSGNRDGSGGGSRDGNGDALGSVDSGVDEPDPVSKVRSDEKARAMLKVLEDALDNGDGRVGTSEFRERTGMSSRGVHYRYDKLKDAGFIEVEYNRDATPEGVAPMKVAVVTETGEEAIARGLAGDTEDVREDTVEDRVDALSGEVRENRKALRDIYDWMQTTDERLAALERQLEEVVTAVEDEHDEQQVDDGGVAERGSDGSSVGSESTNDSGDRGGSGSSNNGSSSDGDDGFTWDG